MPEVKKPNPAADEAAAKELAASQARDEAAEKKLDETVPGGRYIVNGVVVNADGEPIEEVTEA